jgi:hypothetical protein
MQTMNGNRIALVLGLAGLAGLGLATPGMLGANAKPEAAPVAHPFVEPSAAPATDAVHLEALDPVCDRTAIAAPVAAAACAEAARADAARAEATVHVAVQAPRTATVIYPVERPALTQAGSPKNALIADRSQMELQQQKVLLQKRAGTKLPNGKLSPLAKSMKAQAVLADQRERSGYVPQTSAAGRGSDSGAAPSDPAKLDSGLMLTGKPPAQKLLPPK